MLSVIIVSWNVRPLLAGCLDSLLNHESDNASRPAEIIVVDNASSDGTVDWLRTAWPQVVVVASAENLGFGRANNVGLARARGDWLLLLNPDTVVQPGAVVLGGHRDAITAQARQALQLLGRKVVRLVPLGGLGEDPIRPLRG